MDFHVIDSYWRHIYLLELIDVFWYLFYYLNINYKLLRFLCLFIFFCWFFGINFFLIFKNLRFGSYQNHLHHLRMRQFQLSIALVFLPAVLRSTIHRRIHPLKLVSPYPWL